MLSVNLIYQGHVSLRIKDSLFFRWESGGNPWIQKGNHMVKELQVYGERNELFEKSKLITSVRLIRYFHYHI